MTLRETIARAIAGSLWKEAPIGDGDAYVERAWSRWVAEADAILSLPEIAKIREALEKCRDKFDLYEQLHRLKCTAEGDEKADRNREMTVLCDEALSLLKEREG